MSSQNRTGRSHRSDSKRKDSLTSSRHVVHDAHILANLSFAASESYKLLRTNLLFTMPNDDKCRIVGISSAVASEGKTLTAINLSYVLAQSGLRVLLVDADMRLPNVARQMKLKNDAGLSNVLAGMNALPDVICESGYFDCFKVITSGDIPPNPSELLGSPNMEKMLQSAAEDFDFIVLDLPPINPVTDAMTVLDKVDGLLLVVRQDFVSRSELNLCMRKLEVRKEKLLGYVMTDAKDSVKKYSKYGKYGKYGKYRKYKYYSEQSKYYSEQTKV